MSGIKFLFQCLALFIVGVVVNAPDFDVPTVGQKVSAVGGSKGELGFVNMLNAMLVQPIVNAKFVTGAN